MGPNQPHEEGDGGLLLQSGFSSLLRLFSGQAGLVPGARRVDGGHGLRQFQVQGLPIPGQRWGNRGGPRPIRVTQLSAGVWRRAV